MTLQLPPAGTPGPRIHRPVHAQALSDAVTTAGHAPALNGTQPWRWHLTDDHLDLYEDRDHHQAGPGNPRLALVSCGAALHHACISLAADGWQATVSRLPATGGPALLAQIRPGHRIPVQPAALQHLRTTAARRRDPGPALDVPLDADKLRSLTRTAASAGTLLQVLRPDEVLNLVIASRRAPPTGTGEPPDSTLLARSQDRTAALAVLYGHQDRRVDWLRAGEALSAVWITATELGLSVVPMRGAAETDAARTVMSRRVRGACYSYLLLRLATLGRASAAPATSGQVVSQRITRD